MIKCAALAIAACLAVSAAPLACTPVVGSLQDGVLAPFNGALTLTLPYSTSPGGRNVVVQGDINYPVRGGVFSKCMYPGQWTIRYAPSNGSDGYVRYWNVPSSTQPIYVGDIEQRTTFSAALGPGAEGYSLRQIGNTVRWFGAQPETIAQMGSLPLSTLSNVTFAGLGMRNRLPENAALDGLTWLHISDLDADQRISDLSTGIYRLAQRMPDGNYCIHISGGVLSLTPPPCN